MVLLKNLVCERVVYNTVIVWIHEKFPSLQIVGTDVSRVATTQKNITLRSSLTPLLVVDAFQGMVIYLKSIPPKACECISYHKFCPYTIQDIIRNVLYITLHGHHSKHFLNLNFISYDIRVRSICKLQLISIIVLAFYVVSNELGIHGLNSCQAPL